MGPVHFKLSMSDGLTRRISFPIRPSWSELATRIHALCNIPFNRLAVSYLDSDGDEVTLSSEEELRDFYESNVDNVVQGNQLIRFHVVELGPLRDTDNPMDPTSPLQSSTRNTFGRPTPFVFVDHDHLPFGDLFIPSPLDREVDSPHAFVEVVDDEMEKENESTTDMESPSITRDKRKARELHATVSDDLSSSKSVLADETPTKPPIHVQVHGLRPMDSGTFGPPPAASTPTRMSATPTPSRPVLSSDSHDEATCDLPGSFPDPPTPELDDPIDPNVSLSNDLASLLDSLNSMFLEHPEVGHHLRALFRNIGSGSYWNAQGSMARVAEDIQRVARDAQSAVAAGAQEMVRNVRQQAQQEAARRVTEAVGNILRVFGASDAQPSPSNANLPSPAQMPPYHQMPPSDPPGAFPPHPAPPPMNQWNPSLHPPPHPGMVPPFQPAMSSPISMIPLPPPPPAAYGIASVWNQFKPFPGPSTGPQSAHPSTSAAPPPDVSYYSASPSRGVGPSTSELRASLEAAKANYKAEKERYRMEQENRRRERRLAKEGAAKR